MSHSRSISKGINRPHWRQNDKGLLWEQLPDGHSTLNNRSKGIPGCSRSKPLACQSQPCTIHQVPAACGAAPKRCHSLTPHPSLPASLVSVQRWRNRPERLLPQLSRHRDPCLPSSDASATSARPWGFQEPQTMTLIL